MNELYQHKRSDTVKWIVVFLLVFALIGAVVALFVQLDRQTTTTGLGAEAYKVGGLDADGKETDSTVSIVTRNAFIAEGMTAELKEDAAITYEIWFYDADGELLSHTGPLGSDFSGAVPENADTAKIVITPANDEDGKVSLAEVFGYADGLTVTVKR